MTLEKLALLLALPALLFATGCNKDNEVKQTLDYLDETVSTIVSKVTESKDKHRGLADARSYFDGRAAELTRRISELGALKGFQVSDEIKGDMAKRIPEAAVALSRMKITLTDTIIADKQFDRDLDALIDAVQAAVIPE
jgi:hypothetical protein